MHRVPKFEKDEYVYYVYRNEKVVARVIEQKNDRVKIEACLSDRKDKEQITEILIAHISKLSKIL